MEVLSIKGLNKRFDTVEALSDVNLDITPGSIVGLLGPNGAGKTTLLRIINGILSKDSGEVKIFEEDVNLKTARKIGYMPEERGLYDNMTVENQILYFGELKGGDRARLKVVMQEYLQDFNLVGQEKRKVKELSKGNQQKVQIIATLVHEPDLVILDEPFSGFDPINGALLQDLINKLHQRGTTVILSSHNMYAVEEMCRDIVLINKGRVLLSGKLEDIKEANKTNELLLTTSNPLDTTTLESANLVEWVREDAGRHGRKGYSYRMEKKEGVTNVKLFDATAENNNVIHFEEALPSLNDIFIKYTKL